MHTATVTAVVETVSQWLGEETALAAEAAAFLASTFGPLEHAELRKLLGAREASEAESAVELLLFPERGLRLRLERVLADLAPEDAREFERAAIAGLTAGGAVLRRRLGPGEQLCLPLGEEDMALLVSRLRVGNPAHPALRAALDAAYPEAEALALRLALRDMRLPQSPVRVALLLRLIERHPREAARLAEAVAALAGLLAGLTEDADDDRVLAALRRAYAEARASLRRQVEYLRLLAASSFEVLSAQGLRASHVHPEAAGQRMAALGRVSAAVFGVPAWELAATPEDVDLGSLAGAEGVAELIRRMG